MFASYFYISLLYFYDDLFKETISVELETTGLFNLCFVSTQGFVNVKNGNLALAGDEIIHVLATEILSTIFVAFLIKTEMVNGLVVAVKSVEVEIRRNRV